MLIYKDDWDNAKNMLSGWWEGEVRHPLIQIVSPRSGIASRIFYDGWEFCRYPDNPEKVVDIFESWASQTFFGGVAFPNLWINFGPGILAAWLGAQPIFKSNTMWFGNQNLRGIMSIDDIAKVDIDKNNVWWKRVINATRVAVSRHHGKFIVGMTDIGGVLDVTAALRGTVEVVKDMYFNANKLILAIENVTDIWIRCYNELYNIMVSSDHGGSSAWMGIWCPRRWYPIQCDISYMLSPKHFEKFVLPHLKKQCEHLDYTIYHLDGPGQIPHLKYLLNIDELNGIQWVPGAREDALGNDGGSQKWFNMYREILDKGQKRLNISKCIFILENSG